MRSCSSAAISAGPARERSIILGRRPVSTVSSFSARYGGETPGENFDGVLLDTSRIEFDYISDGGEGLTLESAASRKTHGHIGDFDLELPLSGDIGIESRSGNGKSEIVFTFNNNVTGFANASSTCGKLGKVMVDPTDARSVLVRLNEIVCSQTVVTVVLTGVTDDQGHTLNSALSDFRRSLR